jgi:hypothetical protein
MGIVQFTNAIAAATTPERLVPAPAAGERSIHACHIHIEPWPSNTNPVYIGVASAINPTGFVNVISVLDPDPAGDELKSLDISFPSGNNGIRPEELWVKATTDGEGGLGYYLTE